MTACMMYVLCVLFIVHTSINDGSVSPKNTTKWVGGRGLGMPVPVCAYVCAHVCVCMCACVRACVSTTSIPNVCGRAMHVGGRIVQTQGSYSSHARKQNLTVVYCWTL